MTSSFGPSVSPSESTGTVGAQLTLPGGQTVNSITWTVTGPNGAATIVQTGAVNVSKQHDDKLSRRRHPHRANAYTITVSGISADGTVTCAGSGSVQRDGSDDSERIHCFAMQRPTFRSGISPRYGLALQLRVGQLFDCEPRGNHRWVNRLRFPELPMLQTRALSPMRGRRRAARFDTPTAASTNFTCTAVGPVSVTLTVGDGPVVDGGACNAALDTQTIQVQCQAGTFDARVPRRPSIPALPRPTPLRIPTPRAMRPRRNRSLRPSGRMRFRYP